MSNHLVHTIQVIEIVLVELVHRWFWVGSGHLDFVPQKFSCAGFHFSGSVGTTRQDCFYPCSLGRKLSSRDVKLSGKLFELCQFHGKERDLDVAYAPMFDVALVVASVLKGSTCLSSPTGS